MHVGAKFDRFISNIQLTDSQLEDAQSKHERIRDVLRKHYYSSGWTGPISILIGSYGKSTACRPPKDVDILFIMPSSLFERYNRPFTNNQSQLLQDVKDVLKDTYSSTTMRADGQVVVVSFSGSFTVEVIPVFKSNNPDIYYTPDTHNGGSWKTTNPAAEKKILQAVTP
jgi:tRNA nucleotidyltransferase (CCA-adding enzyme)